MHAALIGRKLSHSISPKIHNIIGPYSYSTTELES
jgi:shikimate 5-dehydrogenase